MLKKANKWGIKCRNLCFVDFAKNVFTFCVFGVKCLILFILNKKKIIIMRNLKKIFSVEEAVDQNFTVVYYLADGSGKSYSKAASESIREYIKLSAVGSGKLTVNKGVGVQKLLIHIEFDPELPLMTLVRNEQDDVEIEGVNYYAYFSDMYQQNIHTTINEVGEHENVSLFFIYDGEIEETEVETMIIAAPDGNGSFEQDIEYGVGEDIIIYADSPILNVYSDFDIVNGEPSFTLTAIELPTTVTEIGMYAFAFNMALTSVTIPSSVEKIDTGAFLGCLALTTIYYEGTRKEWNEIEKEVYWDMETSQTKQIICLGDFVPEEEIVREKTFTISADGDGYVIVNRGLGTVGFDYYGIFCTRRVDRDFEEEGVKYYAFVPSIAEEMTFYLETEEVGYHEILNAIIVEGDDRMEGKVENIIITYGASTITIYQSRGHGHSMTLQRYPTEDVNVGGINFYAYAFIDSYDDYIVYTTKTKNGSYSILDLYMNFEGNIINTYEGTSVFGDDDYLYFILREPSLKEETIYYTSGEVIQLEAETPIISVSVPFNDTLKSIVLPNGLSYIDTGDFHECTSLTSITIPNTLTSIGERAFFNTFVKEIRFNGTLEEWGNSVKSPFSNESLATANLICTDCEIINHSEATSGYQIKVSAKGGGALVVNGLHFDEDNVDNYDGYDYLNINPNGNIPYIYVRNPIYDLTYQDVKYYAYQKDNYYLTYVNVNEEGIHKVYKEMHLDYDEGSHQFWVRDYDGSKTWHSEIEIVKSNGLPRKKTVLVYGEGENQILYSDIEIKNIFPKVGTVDDDEFIDDEDFKINLTSIEIPDSVTSIDDSAFRYCGNLLNVIIPDSVTSIGDRAFYYCENLTSINIPNSVTSIGIYAFYECRSLTSVTIPDSVTSIGNDAFYGCSSLTSVTIPDSVTSIGNDAFYWCQRITSITFTGTISQWQAMTKGSGWNSGIPSTTVVTCTDGTCSM